MMGQQRKRKKALNRTGPNLMKPTPRNNSNWVKKGDNKKDDSDKGDSKKTNNQNKGPIQPPKEQQWRPKKRDPVTLPEIAEAPKEKEQENNQPPSQKSQESQHKKQSDNGSRTNDRQNRRDTLPNRNRRHVNRQLTNVRSDWQEFKLISFNVRGLNSESKQKIIYDLLKHNRP
jgi:hypothetical protein